MKLNRPKRRAVNALVPDAVTRNQVVAGIVAGLRRQPKQLSPIHFYDERGSHLFDQICELPEYYLTRTEMRILADSASRLAALLGPEALLLEVGSGASVKTRLLLDHLQRPAGYVPVDISRSHLFAAAAQLRKAYPGLTIEPICADFTRPFPRSQLPHARTAVFFPGSTIGNFDTLEAIALLTRLRRVAGRDGALIVGVDLVKDIAMIERAYNDSARVTAEFNLNILACINREYGADFDATAFTHDAHWVAPKSRIEMNLISQRAQDVRIDAEIVRFAAGERLHTESCHKYTLEGFAALANQSGWRIRQVFTDPERLFSVQYAEAIAS